MPADNRTSWLPNKYAGALTLVLVIQAALFYGASRGERVPGAPPLEAFPERIRAWRMMRDFPIEPEIREQLRADDLLNRLYADPQSASGAALFVAYFRTQRTGQAPHSPKNCLPGSGWEPEAVGYLDIPVVGEPQPIRINRYLVSHGDEKSVVLYWYQSQRRVIASEFSAKFWLVMDSIRYHRSDTALVRVTVPVMQGDDRRATQQGIGFVQAVFPVLKGYLPS
jgi:EpsI family protein